MNKRHSRAKQLRSLIESDQLEFILEAHNGLSAKVVEEAGFKGIWASGLTISAQFGVRDNNEASWTQVLDNVEFMADAVSLPILLDGDTGYGNFNNMRRLVNKLEQRQVAGVCIEDKLFPKTNSFIKGQAQALADIDEFCGKIKAGKDAQMDEDFVIVARVEAFIAGWGLSEALKRAEAYYSAGADAILMHSALASAEEVLAFKQEWGDRAPVVIVPTKYYSTPTEVFREQQFSLVIWANHLLRSALQAMQKTAATIKQEENLLQVEDQVSSVSEVFRIQGAAELKQAEDMYLPSSAAEEYRAIVLAASRGKELGDLTADKPKTMIRAGGRTLLEHIVDSYNASNIKDITVVRGYQKSQVNIPSLRYVDNDDFDTTSELVSLEKALIEVKELPCASLIVSYGDVLFRKYIIDLLKESDATFVIVVDVNWQESRNKNRDADYVHASQAHSRMAYHKDVELLKIGSALSEQAIHGEWMGLLKVAREGLGTLERVLGTLRQSENFSQLQIPSLLNALIEEGEKIAIAYTTGNWLDIDSVEDAMIAGEF